MLCERDLEGELENLERVMKDVKENCSFRDVLVDMKCFGCIYGDFGCLKEMLSLTIYKYKILIGEKKRKEDEEGK